MTLYDLLFRVDNGSQYFNKRVFVLAERLDIAEARARTAIQQKYGYDFTVSLITYSQNNSDVQYAS